MDTKPAEAMTEAHTPTPWAVHRCKKHEETSIFRDGRTVTFDTGQGAAAVCHTNYHTPEIAEANAALIVLAVNSHARLNKEREELKAALDGLLAHTAPLTGGGEYMRDNPPAREAISNARAALLTLKDKE